MNEKEVKRKLAAILSADVKGYSRLMEEDEVTTVRTLEEYRAILSGLVEKHHGRVVDSPGDNLLAQFTSVVDATDAAVEIQKELKAKNADLPENRRMEFRIGINLGDVIAEGERIYGDGVNIAARVESLSDSGGICVSGTAYDQIAKKLPLGYEYLGEQTVKNIEKPIRVYRVLMDPEAAGKVIGEKRPISRQWRWAAVALIAVAGALAIWNFYIRPPFDPASAERMAFPLPDKPSVAVMPFDNLTGDKDQEYFSDGITEEIITALSKTPQLFVIARHSTFSYKGKPVKVQQVAEELGVQYVLEGSVRKAEDQVRITAQLIDALSGHHIWAERYDRDLKDIFAVQDEITLKILTALQVKLTEGEQARIIGKGTNNLEAYLKAVRGMWYAQQVSKEELVMAQKLHKEAITLDPNYARPYVGLGFTYWLEVLLGSSKSPRQSIAKAIEMAKKGLALDDSNPSAHGLLCYIYTIIRQYEKGIEEGERAIELAPSYADAYGYLSLPFVYIGKPKEAIVLIEKAMRLNPTPPPFYYFHLGVAKRLLGSHEESLNAFKTVADQFPDNMIARVGMALAYSLLGRDDEAQAEAKEVLRINPRFSLERYAKRLPYKRQADREIVIDALRKAGLK